MCSQASRKVCSCASTIAAHSNTNTLYRQEEPTLLTFLMWSAESCHSCVSWDRYQEHKFQGGYHHWAFAWSFLNKSWTTNSKRSRGLGPRPPFYNTHTLGIMAVEQASLLDSKPKPTNYGGKQQSNILKQNVWYWLVIRWLILGL